MSGVITAYTKQLLALLAAVMGGFVLGVATTIGMVTPIPALQDAPAWIPHAEFLGWTAGLGTVLAVVGWLYIDYRHVVKA